MSALRSGGFLNLEAVIALGILVAVVLPLAFGFAMERRTLRAHYRDAVALEILDGEMEILAAGEWKGTAPGRQDFTPHGNALTNLPPGRFVLTRGTKTIRLEWLPARGRKMSREVKLP